MKFTGSNKGGRHIGKNVDRRALGEETGKKRKKHKILFRVILIIVILVVAVGAAVAVFYFTSVKPPDVNPTLRPPQNTTGTTANAVSTGDPQVGSQVDNSSGVAPERDRNKYTFVILGTDEVASNTDTIMVATFDDANYTLNVVNIPRDTLVNVSWATKKVNSILGNVGMDGFIDDLSDILGFKVDFYIQIDLTAFAKLVDAVDGVDFDVPVNMNYDDPSQNLHIHFTAGMQHLNGQEALEVVRFRHGYADQDIGRITTQQNFMTSAFEQILQKKNSINITDIANIFMKYVKTDLTAGNVIWFGKELLKVDSSNISFTTMPANYSASIGGVSYVAIYVDQWLQLLNSKINPYNNVTFTAKDLSILTYNSNGRLYVTDGHYQGSSSWGGGVSSGGGSGTSTSKPASPSPSHSPSPTPKPSSSPSGSSSPDPSGNSPGESTASPSESPSPSSSPSASPSSEPSISPSESPAIASPSTPPSSEPSEPAEPSTYPSSSPSSTPSPSGETETESAQTSPNGDHAISSPNV